MSCAYIQRQRQIHSCVCVYVIFVRIRHGEHSVLIANVVGLNGIIKCHAHCSFVQLLMINWVLQQLN